MLELWIISFKTRSLAPSKELSSSSWWRHQECSSSIRSSIRRDKTQVAGVNWTKSLWDCKSKHQNPSISKEQAWKKLLSLQATAKGESLHFSTLILKIFTHCPCLPRCSSKVVEVLPQVHVLEPSETTGALDHKPHTTEVCLHWPNLLSAWRNSVKQYPQENKVKLSYIFHTTALRIFFPGTDNSEDATGCTICCPEIKSSFNRTHCRAESWSDGQQRSSTELLVDTLSKYVFITTGVTGCQARYQS